MNKIIIPYKPHEKQLSFHESNAKFKALITGVGFGKTAAGSNELLRNAVLNPKGLHCVVTPNHKIMSFATLPEIQKFGKELIKEYRKGDNTLILINGTKIILVTADNQRHIDRIRGMTLASFWADEAALFKRELWDVLIGRLRDTHGKLRGVVTTTPKGAHHWLYYYFVLKKHPVTRKPFSNPDEYESFHGGTVDNPYIPKEYLETLKATYAGNFYKQEILGEFVAYEGLVYKDFSKEHNIRKVSVITNSSESLVVRAGNERVVIKEVVGCVDWGFVNPMVFLVVGVDRDGRFFVLEEFYKRRIQVEYLAEHILSVKKKYSLLSEVYADPAEPQYIDKLRKLGIRAKPSNNSVIVGINRVNNLISSKSLFVSDTCVNLINEFHTYRYKDDKDDMNTSEEPVKTDDHALDALRYCCATHKTSTSNTFFFTDTEGLVF